MKNNLIIARKDWEIVRLNLLGEERKPLVFLLCGFSQHQASYSFLVKEIILVSNKELVHEGKLGLELKIESLIRIMNEASKKNLSLVEMHSHLLTEKNVTFSPTDLKGQEDFAQYLFDIKPSNSYGALVLGSDSVDGLIWLPGQKNPGSIDYLKIIGSPIEFIHTTGAWKMKYVKRKQCKLRHHMDRYARQILAFGSEGQKFLRQLKIGIVGLGGLGSHVAQQLSHLGVEDFVLVDCDKVEESNLNRLVGTTHRDVGKAKVDVAHRLIQRVNRKINIRKMPTEIRTKQALEALKNVDLIFGCVDSYAPRLIMSELASAYLIPYIDCGFGIYVSEGRISEAGGRVIVVLPDTPCLLCAKELDLKLASQELAPKEEQEFNRQQGYIAGADIQAPSVISLDGIIASIAVTEFLALATGFRKSNFYTYYDMLQEKTIVVSRIVKARENCIICKMRGSGDLANVQRYSKEGLPSDIPSPFII